MFYTIVPLLFHLCWSVRIQIRFKKVSLLKIMLLRFKIILKSTKQRWHNVYSCFGIISWLAFKHIILEQLQCQIYGCVGRVGGCIAIVKTK